eukprot:Skav202154  [mRNA]  locus=scaffold970:209215:209832:- [translate_table: standard]
MCLPTLTHKELSQLEVSNYLLFVALRLFLAALCTMTPGVLEHPRQPKNPERATIWALPWLQAMFQSGHATQELIWQAQYGAGSPKPTHLGICHLPKFKRIMKQHQLPTDWNALRILKGKDQDNTWQTSSAKEYPPRLNEALAELHVDAMMSRRALSPFEHPSFPAVDAAFQQLYAGHVNPAEQCMQPDYAPQNGRSFPHRAQFHM